MKHLSYILLFCVALSCSSSTETQPSDRLIVQKGKTLTIFLKSNVTTGHQWYLVHHPSIVDSISQRYDGQGFFLCNGAGGMETWKFEGVKKGVDTLRFSLSREKPDDSYSEYERRYVVEVE